MRLLAAVLLPFLPVAAMATPQATAPAVTVTKSIGTIRIATGSDPKCATATAVKLGVAVTNFASDDVTSSVTVTGGRVDVVDNAFVWDLAGQRRGTYMAIVTSKDAGGQSATGMTSIDVTEC